MRKLSKYFVRLLALTGMLLVTGSSLYVPLSRADDARGGPQSGFDQWQQAVVTDTAALLPLDPAEQAEVDEADAPPEADEPFSNITIAGPHIVWLPIIGGESFVQQNAVSRSSISGYWQLSDSGGRRDDRSGFGNDLIPVNGVSQTSGVADKAVDLEASKRQYLYINDGDQQGLDVTGSLTIMGWFRLESRGGSYRILASKYGFGDRSQRAYRLDIRSNSNKIGFIASPNGSFSNNYLLEKQLSSRLSGSRWYHIAAVFDANQKKMKLYLNCDQIASRNVSHNKIHNSNAPFMLGANQINGKPASFFDGKLDDWQVYSRVLSNSEIQQGCTTGGTFQAPPDDDPAPAPPPSGGNSSCNPSNGRGGLKPGSYVRNVAGLQAGIIVGKGYNPNKPTYLAFYLPGDDGNEWKAFGSQPNGPIAKFIDDQNWIFVAPKHPNGRSWWQNWNGNHVTKFTRVLDEMFNKYNLCRNVIFGSGGSGGSEFFTRQFFPVKGGKYPSHNVILCGGNDPSLSQLKNLAKNSNVVKRSEFHFVYGTADRLTPLIRDAISVYKKAGFKVTTKVYSNKGHCNKWKSQGLPTIKDQLVSNWKRMARNVGVYR